MRHVVAMHVNTRQHRCYQANCHAEFQSIHSVWQVKATVFCQHSTAFGVKRRRRLALSVRFYMNVGGTLTSVVLRYSSDSQRAAEFFTEGADNAVADFVGLFVGQRPCRRAEHDAEQNTLFIDSQPVGIAIGFLVGNAFQQLAAVRADDSEGGEAQTNEPSLPLCFSLARRPRLLVLRTPTPRSKIVELFTG